MKPHLLILGPMVGRHPGRVTGQGERLVDLFAREGYQVDEASSVLNRYLRALHIVCAVLTRSRRVDIVILQVFGGASFVVEDIASFLVRLCGQKIVIIVRGGDMPVFIKRFPKWTLRVLARASVVIAPSGFLKRALEYTGFPCVVIPNVIELSHYPYNPRRNGQPRLLWMRAFHPGIYNPAMAIRVFARVRQVLPEATLVMAGQDHPYQPLVKRLAESLGVREAVEFPGFLDMDAKVREAGRASIFLNTNYIDNMPVSVIEAMAFGLPVVATNVGGLADIITDGENGLLVPVDADAAMAEAIIRVLCDPELSARLSAQGRVYAERCTWEGVRPQFEAVFARVHGQGGS